MKVRVSFAHAPPVAHALVRAASPLLATHGDALHTTAEAENGPKVKRRRRARWTASQCLFLIVAIGSLGLYGYTYIERVVCQAYESRLFDRAAGAVAGVDRAGGNSMPAPAFPVSIIGRLSIPRLQFSAMVREGLAPRTLRVAVGHIPSTPLPGQAGNVGLAGHRDTFFRDLKDLKLRDEIQFSTPKGTFKYRVESLTVVDPDDVAVLAPSSENVLTLVTCYPFWYIGSAPKRFVVRAKQVLSEPAPNLAALEIR